MESGIPSAKAPRFPEIQSCCRRFRLLAGATLAEPLAFSFLAAAAGRPPAFLLPALRAGAWAPCCGVAGAAAVRRRRLAAPSADSPAASEDGLKMVKERPAGSTLPF